jgi:DNA repair ATPase RecN
MSDENPSQPILAAILQLSAQVGEISKNLAVNTNETSNIVKRLDTLNGSVAKHEAGMNAHTQAIALISQSLDRLTQQDNKKEDKKSDWLDWLLKGLVVLALIIVYTILVKTGLLTELLHP